LFTKYDKFNEQSAVLLLRFEYFSPVIVHFSVGWGAENAWTPRDGHPCFVPETTKRPLPCDTIRVGD